MAATGSCVKEAERQYIEEALGAEILQAADAIRACHDATDYAPAKLWRNLFSEVARAAGAELRYQPVYTRFMSAVWARRYRKRERWRK